MVVHMEKFIIINMTNFNLKKKMKTYFLNQMDS
jgi:hypothetical protein